MENEVMVDHPTKKLLYWNHPEVSYKCYINKLIESDDILDYVTIVQYETGVMHLKQIMNTIGFMCKYLQSYYVTARASQ
jgi:hypothetical protein